ncbi:hypothetical protein PbB2_00575 [Candidatus Phycosocius bacilliformis]|uniref:Uncharacterized protein n=1 Tax=Candidatus Phycosocius bacilliformis TaxID=1445552 RepID=A0A2P2E786_9PROT|nr:hypothetical protein PbB2_00575 [Candidatus Phycosocius bacilliformis]
MLMQPSNSHEWRVSDPSVGKASERKKTHGSILSRWIDGLLQFAIPWPAHAGSSSVTHIKHLSAEGHNHAGKASGPGQGAA